MQHVLLFLVSLAVRSAALAALALAGIWILRLKSAAARHAVWTSVLFGMMALAVLAPVLPPVAIPILRVAPEAYVFPETAGTPRIDLAQPAVTPSVAAEPQRAARGWQDAAAAIYFLGVLFFLARLVFGYLFTVRLVRASAPVTHPGADRLYESTWISVPLTVGYLRPKILLPAGWQSWGSSKYEAVLAHERTHIRRADWAISLLAGLNRCIFWFHPLAWWLERKLASLAEQACDDSALLLVKSEHYAQALLDMAAAVRSEQGRLVWEAMAMAKAAEVKQRIERILDDTRQIPPAFTRGRWVALLACSVPLVYVAAVVRPVPASAQSQPRTQAEIYDFLKGKRQLTASDVSVMEQYLVTNPHDLDLRSELVLYYFANGMRAERNSHILWMVANHPESNAALISSLGISPRPNNLNDAAEYQRVADLWRQQAARPPNRQILDNAAQFFSQTGADYNEAERLLLSARNLYPNALTRDDKLGRLYAKAILGATGDPAFPNSAPDLAARVRAQLETSNEPWDVYSTANALRVAQRPVAGQPLPPGILNLDDHPLLLTAIDFSDRLLERARELGLSGGLPGIGAPPAVPRKGMGSGQPNSHVVVPPPFAAADGLPPAPAPLHQVEPLYPPLARQARISGTVKLAVEIGSSGDVEQITVISGHPLMVPAALEAVRQWTFPAGSAGKYLQNVNFTLPPGEAVAAAPAAQAAPSRIRVGANVQAASLIRKVDPVYPPAARTGGIEGNVVLQIVIGEDGTVQKVDPVDGHPLLLAAAADAVRQWTYRPTLFNSRPVEVTTTVTIPFALNQ